MYHNIGKAYSHLPCTSLLGFQIGIRSSSEVADAGFVKGGGALMTIVKLSN